VALRIDPGAPSFYPSRLVAISRKSINRMPLPSPAARLSGADLLAAAALYALLAAAPALAQVAVDELSEEEFPTLEEPPVLADAPLVFIDCRRCDQAHIRTEVQFVNFVREASDAQIHVLITDQPTAGGGQLYTLAFIGRRSLAGMNQTLTYASLPSQSAAQVRDGLTSMLKLGLVPYVSGTRMAERLELRYRPATGAATRAVTDRWNSWTFEVYGGGNFNTETTQDSWNARYGFYANRVTANSKVRLRPYFNNNARTIRRENADDIHLSQRRHGFESYYIRSLGPHFGAGVFADYTTSTLDNLRHGATLTPAIEYSVFPYAEATRRAVTLTYRVGYELADYFEETIFDRTEEALLNNSLRASVQVQQPWGSISSGLTGFTYLHDFRYHRVTLNGNVSFRLGGGVSLNVGGSYQRINDQLGLPRGEASFEDILLQRRRLATAYRGSGSIGLSYTFGSIFSNVVNPRL
jgi:hypothetical protein